MATEERHKKERDQWNIFFSLIFAALLALMAVVLMRTGSIERVYHITSFEVALIVLALFRITRLFVYDAIMAFFRDLFLDVKVIKGEVVRTKFDSGFRRSISDIVTCPWCCSMWASAIVLFLYLICGPVFTFILSILALAGLASLVQIAANLLGWSAEKKKLETKALE